MRLTRNTPNQPTNQATIPQASSQRVASDGGPAASGQHERIISEFFNRIAEQPVFKVSLHRMNAAGISPLVLIVCKILLGCFVSRASFASGFRLLVPSSALRASGYSIHWRRSCPNLYAHVISHTSASPDAASIATADVVSRSQRLRQTPWSFHREGAGAAMHRRALTRSDGRRE